MDKRMLTYVISLVIGTTPWRSKQAWNSLSLGTPTSRWLVIYITPTTLENVTHVLTHKNTHESRPVRQPPDRSAASSAPTLQGRRDAAEAYPWPEVVLDLELLITDQTLLMLRNVIVTVSLRLLCMIEYLVQNADDWVAIESDTEDEKCAIEEDESDAESEDEEEEDSTAGSYQYPRQSWWHTDVK